MSSLSDLPPHLLWPLYATGVVVSLALVGALLVASLVLWRLVSLHVLGTDDYARLPRPRHRGKWWLAPLFGDLDEVRNKPPADAHLDWMNEVGSVYCYRGVFYTPRLWLADPVAMHHILGAANSYSYPKPYGVRRFLAELLGEGVFVAEGEAHKRQRKIIQPAFSVSAVRDLVPTFFEHANRCASVLAATADACDGASDTARPHLLGETSYSAREGGKGRPVVDVTNAFSKVTLDIIGDAGFSWNFNSFGQDEGVETHAFSEAFGKLMKSLVGVGMLQFVQFYLQNTRLFWWVRHIPTKRKRMVSDTYAIMSGAATQIIQAKRRAILEEMRAGGGGAKEDAAAASNKAVQNAAANGAATAAPKLSRTAFDESVKSHRSSAAKDLLHLMMRSNMAADVRDAERLSDDEMLGLMTSLLLAGHETTSTQLTWLFWELGQPRHHAIQERLRAEVLEHLAGRDSLDHDSLASMPYLDRVTREIMRLWSPVVQTNRSASRDDVVPLSRAYRTRDGKGSFDSVRVRKGQLLFVPISALNRSREIWGDDADEFDPDRWERVPEAAKRSGFPQQLMTFIEGPRGCIGNRFAITEFKVLVCALLRQLRFEAVEGWEVDPKQSIVQRPRIKGQEDIGMQMPLRISRI